MNVVTGQIVSNVNLDVAAFQGSAMAFDPFDPTSAYLISFAGYPFFQLVSLNVTSGQSTQIGTDFSGTYTQGWTGATVSQYDR